MKSSDDGREMSFQMLRELVWIPPARNGEYNSLKYKFHFIKYNLIANIILFRFLCIYVLKSLDCHNIYIYLGDCIVETNICKMQTVFGLNGQSKYWI